MTLIKGRVNNELGTCGFLFVVNDDHASILHGYGDTVCCINDIGVTNLTLL